MLEVLYDTNTKEVRAWNADDKVQGNFKPKVGQEVIILPISPPDFESDWYKVDLANKKVVGNPDYIRPIVRDLVAEIDDLKAEIALLKK